MKSNLVHTYVMGDSFDNIYGGKSDASFASITHLLYLDPGSQRKWPGLLGSWQLSTGRGYSQFFPTLRQAKASAKAQWPDCYFKRPKDF